MTRTVVLLTVVLVAASPALAGPAVHREVLDNKVTVLVREDPAATVVAISLQVRAGSAFEPPHHTGITNLLQRTMLRGTARRTAREIAEAAEDLGGELEASAEVETAELRGAALARHWRALLGLMADVALAPALAPAELERERALITAQIRTRDDTPFQHAFDALLADLYGDHPYARRSLGRQETIARVTREMLVAHHADVYRPERMVVAVSGGVPTRSVVTEVRRLFGQLSLTPGAAPVVAPASEARANRRVVERPASQAQVLVGFLAPPLADPRYAAARVLAAVLGGGMSGRLFAELRERRGLAYSVGAIGSYRTGPAYLVTYLGTAPGNADAAVAGVLAEVERLRGTPVAEPELERAKAYVLGTLAMDRRTNARLAWYLAFFETIGVGWEYPDRYARAVSDVTVDDLSAVAQRYLRNPSVLVLRPPTPGGRQ